MLFMTYFDYIHRNSNKSLIEHDKRFHPNGYDSSRICTYREGIPTTTSNHFAPDKNKSVVQNYSDFAAYWHRKAGNFRRGLENIPYIEHPKDVSALLRKWGYSDAKNPITMSVAYGHDLIEEAKTPRKDIEQVGGEIGRAVLGGIEMLTFIENPLWMTKEERNLGKREYINGIAKEAPLGILAVKMADRLCNTMDFVKAKNPYAHTYLEMGEPLFSRIDEFPNKDIIKKTLELVRNRVNRLPKPLSAKVKTKTLTNDTNGKTIYPKVRKARGY